MEEKKRMRKKERGEADPRESRQNKGRHQETKNEINNKVRQ